MEVEIAVEERGRKGGGTPVDMVPHQLHHRNGQQGQTFASQVVCAREIHIAIALS